MTWQVPRCYFHTIFTAAFRFSGHDWKSGIPSKLPENSLPLSSAQDTHLPAQKKSQPRQDVPMKKKLHCRSRTSKKRKSLPPHGNPIKNIKHHD